ncbi:glycoside hydrolase family 43 protein [Mucilaginibacter sp. 3215]|uniref:glycoside hydrolase family 43 protein n=1 Tax=Mucilaginibacter sp. 3215 TaxID=3373912 RepID=UPI003D1C87E2
MKYTVLILILFIFFNNQAQSQNMISGGDFKDTDGNQINAHGAGVLYYNEVYYLFGEIKKGKTWLVPGQSWEDYRVPAGGVSCYSSTDLKHWKNLGTALRSVTGDQSNDLDTGRVIERPKVLYNEKTKKFVMWFHNDRNDYQDSKAGIAISDSPEGPYTYLGSIKPNNQMLRDMTLFKDTDGKAYVVYSSEDNNTMHVCLLTDDYLKPTEHYTRILIDRNRESPALFKNNGKYFLITSGCSGWSPNAASYATADSIMGPWKEVGNPCSGANAEQTFFAQGNYVLPVSGKPSNFIFMGDLWNKLDLEKSGYLWIPFEVIDGEVKINY